MAIFKVCDDCTSTCLGLTSKAMYAAHQAIHGPHSINSMLHHTTMSRDHPDGKIYLFQLLEDWMYTTEKSKDWFFGMIYVWSDACLNNPHWLQRHIVATENGDRRV